MMMLIWKLRVIVYWLKLKSVQLDYNCVIVITDEKFNGSQGWLYDSLHCIHLSYEIKYLVNLMGQREKTIKLGLLFIIVGLSISWTVFLIIVSPIQTRVYYELIIL